MAEEKILTNEKMSEEELEKVAGGNSFYTAVDTAIMQDLGYNVALGKPFNQVKAKLTAAFATVGVTVKVYESNELPNKYFYKNKEISRESALTIAAIAKDKPIPDFQYYFNKYAYK